jgi:hypothetical protein
VYTRVLNYETVIHTLILLVSDTYTRILKLHIKQIHAYVGLSLDDWSIPILCRCSANESQVRLLRLLPHEGDSEMTSICVDGGRIMIQMGYV